MVGMVRGDGGHFGIGVSKSNVPGGGRTTNSVAVTEVARGGSQSGKSGRPGSGSGSRSGSGSLLVAAQSVGCDASGEKVSWHKL